MPLINPIISNSAGNEKEKTNLWRDLEKLWTILAEIVNGRVSFGWGANLTKENIDGVWVAGSTGAVANADFVLTHNLQRLPVGYIVMTKSQACDIYTGAGAWTITTITLKGTVALTDVLLFVV